MTDPVTAVTSGIAIGRTGLGLLQFLWDKGREADVIAAQFDPDGVKFEGGDPRITVQRIKVESDPPTKWWYRIVLVSGFEFVPYATNPYLEIRQATIDGEQRPRDRMVFRWIVPPQIGLGHGGYEPGNAETNFVVVGYRASAIVKHFTAPSKRQTSR